MTRFFLDTQEWSYLFEPRPGYTADDLQRIRSRLLTRTNRPDFAVMGSASLLQEILPLHRHVPDLYAAIVPFMFRVVGKNWLRPLNEMSVAEAINGGILTGRAPFIHGATRAKMRVLADTPDDVAAVEADHNQALDDFEADQARAKASITGELQDANDGEPVKMLPLIRKWWDTRDIEDWVTDLIAGGVERGHLPPDAVTTISADTLPSTWHFTSFKLARIKQNLGEGETVQRSDIMDAEHYVAAVYSDILVTEDRKFTRTAELLPVRPFKIETFDQFVARLR